MALRTFPLTLQAIYVKNLHVAKIVKEQTLNLDTYDIYGSSHKGKNKFLQP